jgi:hypothetical protein
MNKKHVIYLLQNQSLKHNYMWGLVQKKQQLFS